MLGELMANFLGQLCYFEKVALAFDNEPILQAAARVAQTIRKTGGVETVLQPGKYYNKGRTSLAERMVQTVRNQQKTLIAALGLGGQVKLQGP